MLTGLPSPVQRLESTSILPEKDNLIFARLMDAGKYLKAKISQIDKKGSFYQIKIGIYLMLFAAAMRSLI